MMSRAPRWQDSLVNSKTSKPALKKEGKEPAALTVSTPSGSKLAGSSTLKTSVSYGRSHSLSSRGSDSSGNKAGGYLKSGSLSFQGHQGHQGHQGTRPASRPARPPFRLCGSRSFSSLHDSSLTAAPLIRGSRSLSRLDQRSTGDVIHAEKKELNSEEQTRDGKDRCQGDKAETMKTSSSSESSSTAACHHHCNKVKKQTRDGVYTLCAMTSGMRHNWVQAVLKNVRPSLTPDTSSSLSEQKTQQKSQHTDTQLTDSLEKSEHPNCFLQEHKTSDCAEETHQQQKEQEVQTETEQRSADGRSASPSISPSHLSSPTQTDVMDASSCVEGDGNNSSTSTTILSNAFDEHSNTQSECWQHIKSTPQSEEQQEVSINTTCAKEKHHTPCEQQTGQLVKELEQTQKELSRLQQLNRNLLDELQQERARHSGAHPQDDLLSNSPSEQALQQLQKMNHSLRAELEAQNRSHEEAREVELRRRVDLLAQQAQLLVTGDATALAQAHLEQDRRQFHEQQVEWERCVASLKSQLSVSEEQRREAGSRLTQLQQELQGYHRLQQEADRLHKHLQDVTDQLRANEEAQDQKEARLQKHLVLLQASQDRERKSLTASLAQAEQHSRDLQERLDRAEQQAESLSKTKTWTRDIEEAQQQLQEELAHTVSAVQKLQEEKEQLDRRCQELQNQLCEADGEVSRLQNRLKTDETHYYNLEHSYERVSEELQLALGKIQQKESETQDMREGYERLLDGKEQELSEVLLKMEVLGNSLEETEVKLNEVLKGSTYTSSQLKDESSESAQQHETQATDPHSGSRPKATDSYPNAERAGDDPERYMSVIQILETKLYITEEKLRDIMQRLEEHQSHISCQDPHLCSQLTRSRATAQHLGLLLHSQAKQSRRFAQETESHCRMLVGRFQVALNIVQACRERLHASQINITDFEKQLATVAACLQQGEKDAEKQQHESHNACKGVEKILNDETLAGAESNVSAKSKPTDTLTSEDDVESVGKCLMREVFVVEKMVSVLESQCGIKEISLVLRDTERDLAHQYTSIITQRIALKRENWTETAECDTGSLNRVISGVCAEAELIYAALKCQQQSEGMTQVNNQEVKVQRKSLADINPPELAPYEEQVQGEGRGSEGAAKPVEKDESETVATEKEPEWLQRLISRLRKRAKFLHQLCQEVSECSVDDNWENASAADLNWMQEQAKLIYLSDRLRSDLEKQQSEVLQDKLQALCEERDITLKDEQEAFNHALCQLQEDNSVLREELERAEQKVISVETGNQRLLEDIRRIEDYHKERMKKLEIEFQEKIRELQQIHEEEMKHLHGYYTKSAKEKQSKTCSETPGFIESCSLPEQTVMEKKAMEAGDAAATREAYKKDPEAPCDQGFTAVEEIHRRLISELQQQHQTEVAALLKEKDKLLQEETAATMAAIVAMRRAHKQELEKSRQSQHIKGSADVTQLHLQYEKEIQLMHKELELLSAQHTQKCLENSQLSQELQHERRSMMQYQKENQELRNKQRQTDGMSHLHFSLNGKHVAPQVNDFYEMEVILRAREAEMQFLRQESRSLREELKIARMDKIYAQNKLKAFYKNSQDERLHDVSKLWEDVKFATWSPGGGVSGQSFKDTVTNASNAAFLKKTEKSSLTREIRGVRSKSLKDGLSVQERMKLFESF